jgi:hypothetical protein
MDLLQAQGENKSHNVRVKLPSALQVQRHDRYRCAHPPTQHPLPIVVAVLMTIFKVVSRVRRCHDSGIIASSSCHNGVKVPVRCYQTR